MNIIIEKRNLVLEIDDKGKGKEYYENNKLKFEGVYLNGKRWNGNGYTKYGNKVFEIRYGKGYVKYYNCNGKLEYEGECLN